MTGSTFKRKNTVVRTNLHGGDIHFPVFLYLPCSRNEVSDDEFHGSVSVHFHIDFAGQRPAVFAEGNDPVGYLYAYHFLRVNAFHVIHLFASVVRNLHYVQEVVFGGGSGRRYFHTPCSSFVGVIGAVGQCVIRIVSPEYPELFSFAADFFYLGISRFGQQYVVLQHSRIAVLRAPNSEAVSFYYRFFNAVQ